MAARARVVVVTAVVAATVDQLAGRVGELERDLLGLVGEPEVDQHHAIVVGDEHVVGLEVAVHDAGGVGGHEAERGLLEHRDDLAPRSRPTIQPLPQRHATQPLHHQEDTELPLAAVTGARVVAVGGGAGVVDLDDVGVPQLRERLRLALQRLLPSRAALVAIAGR